MMALLQQIFSVSLVVLMMAVVTSAIKGQHTRFPIQSHNRNLYCSGTSLHVVDNYHCMLFCYILHFRPYNLRIKDTLDQTFP